MADTNMTTAPMIYQGVVSTIRNGVSADEVKATIVYDPLTGNFSRSRVGGRFGRDRPGKPVGTRAVCGYVVIWVGGKLHYAHLLAWAIHTGEWPTAEVDHRDGDKSNNRWSNLRLATHIQQAWNKGMRNDNTSGFVGVSWDKSRHLWSAFIYLGGKHKYLGRYQTKEQAGAAYAEAAQSAHGEFYRPNGAENIPEIDVTAQKEPN